MAEKIKLYYSVDILLEKMELEDLLENNLKNSFSEHKTSVWLENIRNGHRPNGSKQSHSKQETANIDGMKTNSHDNRKGQKGKELPF